MARPNQPGANHDVPQTVEALFAALESPLLRYTRQIVQNADSSQEIVQETFMRLHQNINQIKHPRAWLFRTAHNLALNHRRADQKIVPLDPETDAASPARLLSTDSVPQPDENLFRLEAIEKTRCCLLSLGDREREVVRLKFEEGLSYEEIGKQTGLGAGHVGYILHHALKRLAVELEQLGVEL